MYDFSLFKRRNHTADLTSPLQEGEPFQRKKQPDHAFAHSVGLFLGRGDYLTVDKEGRMMPSQYCFDEFFANELFMEEKREDRAGEECGDQAVLVRRAFDNKKTEMRQIESLAEDLDDGDERG